MKNNSTTCRKACLTIVACLALCLGKASGVTRGRRLTGSTTFFTPGRIHTLQYDVTHATAAVDNMIALDKLENVSSTTCNLDPTSLQLNFTSYDAGANFYDLIGDIRLLSDDGSVYLSTSSVRGNGTNTTTPGGCPASRSRSSPGSHAEFMMRKMIADPEGVPPRRHYSDTCNPNGCIVTLRTAPVNYENVYQNATINYSSKPQDNVPPNNTGWQVCLGLNADPQSCAAAKRSIPLYSSEVLDVTCDNCFLGLRAEVFFNLEIGLFLLRRLAAGFRGMSLNSGLGLDLAAHVEKPILAVDKQLFQAGGQDTPVLAFRIGPVPFLIWFEGSIDVTGDLTFAAQAQAQAGLLANYNIGDNYIEWQAGSGWSHVAPTPQLTLTPSVSGSASFDVTGSIALPAQLSMHANQIFTHTVSLHPNAQLHVHGDATIFKKDICVDGSLSAALVTEGQLHMNILWHLINVDASFGPETLWSKTQSIPKHCVAANVSQPLR